MKKRRLIIAPIIFLLVLMLAAPAAAAPRLYKLTGGGSIIFSGWGKESYGISARQIDEEGNARGQVHFTWHYSEYAGGPSPWIMQADVLYLAVDPNSGNAWIGGVITKSNYPYYEGTEFYLQVQDGGEGKGAGGPDMIGYTYLGVPANYALYKPSGPLFEWIKGNIQLK
jgi:hypothetical protein